MALAERFIALPPERRALAFGQTVDKKKHVGYLVWSSEGPRGHLEQALLDAMRANGYVEGKNLVIERRYVEGNADDLRAAASELAAMKLNLIVSTYKIKDYPEFKHASHFSAFF